MKRMKIFKMCSIAVFLNLWFSFSFAGNLQSPIGTWLSFDEKTHEKRSVITITEKDGIFSGKITKIYFKAGEAATDRCVKCTGELHDQLILGLPILREMQQRGENTWQGGEIVDPENGKSYHCLLMLSEDGSTMTVRGYIGLPLLGRSQTWQRIK